MSGVEEKENKELKKRIASISGYIVAFLGILCVVGGFTILIYQFYYWLKMDKWLAMPFSFILSKVISLKYIYNSEWKGMAKLVIWIISQSSALVLIFLGFIITIFGDLIYLNVAKDYRRLY